MSVIKKELDKTDYKILSVLVLCSLVYYFQYFFSVKNSPTGLPMPEDSLWYLEYAYRMLSNFDLDMHVNDILYLTYNMLLIFLLALFNNTETIVVLQTISTAFAVILVYQIALIIFDRATAIISSLFYAFSLDLNIWTVYILSDSFFSVFMLANIFALLKYFLLEEKSYRNMSIFTTVAVIFFRPNGLIAFIFVLPWLVYMFGIDKVKNIIKQYKKTITIISSCFIVAFFILLYLNTFDLFFESLHYNFKLLLYNVYAKGWIYDIDTKYTHNWFPNYTIIYDSELLSFIYFNYRDILLMMLKKAAVFLGYWVVFSDAKYKISMFIFSIPTIFFIIGSISTYLNKKIKGCSLLFLAISSVFIFCVIFFVDSMYRYRAPVMPYIYIIMAYGITCFVSTIQDVVQDFKKSFLN